MGTGSEVLTDLVDGLEEPALAVELRLKINQSSEHLKGRYDKTVGSEPHFCRSFQEYGNAVIKHLENVVESDAKLAKAPVNYEGVRVSDYGGWFLLRLSLHDLVLPLNIEAPTEEDAKKLGHVVREAVKDFSALDTSTLDKFIQAV